MFGSIEAACSWSVSVFLNCRAPQLNVQTKPVEPLVEGGAQVQQVLNIECINDFSEAPLLNIKFRYAHTSTKLCTFL